MMRCPIPLLILLLAPVFATGCREAPDAEVAIPPEPRDVYVTVKAYLDEKSELPVFDEKYHHAELVRRGDKLSFACECDDGLELTVSEPKLAIDLEALESLIDKRDGDTQEERLENLRGELERARAYLQKPAAPAATGDNAYLATQALPGGNGDNADFLQAFLGEFLAVIPDAPEARLFESPWREPGFQPGNRVIGPFTVGSIKGKSVWKFTWKVRVQGQPGSEECGEDPHLKCWDPHLMGDPDW